MSKYGFKFKMMGLIALLLLAVAQNAQAAPKLE